MYFVLGALFAKLLITREVVPSFLGISLGQRSRFGAIRKLLGRESLDGGRQAESSRQSKTCQEKEETVIRFSRQGTRIVVCRYQVVGDGIVLFPRTSKRESNTQEEKASDERVKGALVVTGKH